VKRSVREQVVSGFRIGGLIVLSLTVFAGLLAGCSLAFEKNLPQRATGMVLVAAVTSLLFLTTQHWAKWVFAALAFSAFRLPFSLLFARPLDRKNIVICFAYVLAAAALTYRYIHRKPRSLEKMGLVALVLGIALAVASLGYLPLLAGLFVLGICELADWLKRQRRSHRRTSIPLPQRIE
jgi:hypothetical protein